jgi:hypothetical protein
MSRVARQSSASEDVNAEVEQSTGFGAVTNRRVENTRQTENLVRSVMICRVRELAITVKVRVTLRPTISRSVHHGVEPHLGLMTRY